MDHNPLIGLFCPGDGSGGPWRYVHSIMGHIDPHEFSVALFCDIRENYSANSAVNVVNLCAPALQLVVAGGGDRRPSHKRINRPRVPKSISVALGFHTASRKLSRTFATHPVDLFHTQNTGCEESPVAARLAGIPIILGTFHVDSTYDLERKRSGITHRTLEHISNHCLTHAIGVSQKTSDDWIARTHLPRRKVTTIHNGIDPDKFKRRLSREDARRMLNLPADAIIVGGIGRLDPAKGFTFLIDAVAQLATQYPTLHLALAGQGPLRESLEAQAESCGIANRVHFLGFLYDVQPVYDALDLYAIPSLCEALPYALLEAMATGLPAIGSTVGGIPEVITPETGLLVPPKDPHALASAIAVLLNEPELRSRMGAAARQRVVTHFHEKDMVRKTLDLYRTLLNRR